MVRQARGALVCSACRVMGLWFCNSKPALCSARRGGRRCQAGGRCLVCLRGADRPAHVLVRKRALSRSCGTPRRRGCAEFRRVGEPQSRLRGLPRGPASGRGPRSARRLREPRPHAGLRGEPLPAGMRAQSPCYRRWLAGVRVWSRGRGSLFQSADALSSRPSG